jgi:4-amino-4-deoxy-L-arabinose transferase-like glycosyltransferase
MVAPAVVVIIQAGIVQPYWSPTWDSAVYLSLARSISLGEGYHYLGHPHTLYPPGLPLILAGILSAAGPAYGLMRAVMALLALLGGVAAYALLKPRLGAPRAALIGCLFPIAFPVVHEITFVLSDVPFAFFALAAMALARHSPRPPRGWRLAGLCVSLLAATAFRTVGLVLVASIGAHGIAGSILRHRGRDALWWAAAAALLLAPAAGWILYVSPPTGAEPIPEGIPASSSNLDLITRADPRGSDPAPASAADLLRRVRENAGYYAEVGAGVILGRREPIRHLPWTRYLIILLPLIGLFRLARRRLEPADLFAILYGLVLLAWPFHYQRFVIPVLPLLFLWTLSGVEGIALSGLSIFRRVRIGPSRLPSRIAAGLLLIVALIHLGQAAGAVDRERARPYYRGAALGIMSASDWILGNTDPGDVIVVFQAAIVHWLTERRALIPPWSSPPERQLEMIQRSGASWVMINPMVEGSGGYLRRLVEERKDLFRPAAEVDGVRIWQVVRAP